MEEKVNVSNSENAAPAETEKVIVFTADPKAWRNWYNLSAPVSSAICLGAIVFVAIFMLQDTSRLTRLSGVLMLLFGVPYIVYYFYQYFLSRRYIATAATLSPDYIELVCGAFTKRLPLSELVMTCSYSSANTLCIIAATADDYIAIPCPSCYIFSKARTQLLKPFYAINKALMDRNQNHINYKRNKKAKKLNPFRVPQFVFETEFYNKRTEAFIEKLRKEFPLRERAPQVAETATVSRFYD